VLIFSLNIFFEHLFAKKNRGTMRGTFLLLGNLGVLMGPVVAAWAIDIAGYTGMYALSLALFILLAVFIHFGTESYRDANYDFGRIIPALKHTLEKRSLRNVITANFVLQFFYAWMVIYTPIYLSQKLGFSWDEIGIIFFVMLLAFVVLDYPLGKIADYLGSEKELAVIGFLIMATSVGTLALVQAPSFATVTLILLFSRIGAATVEAMTEIHFFKVAKDSDPGLLALFSDIRPLAYVLAPLIGALAIALLPFQMSFVVLSAILMVGFVASFYLEDTSQWWVRAHKN
jgi:MFS family permease